MNQADLIKDELKVKWANASIEKLAKIGSMFFVDFCHFEYKRKTSGFKNPLSFSEFLLSSTKDIDLYS